MNSKFDSIMDELVKPRKVGVNKKKYNTTKPDIKVIFGGKQ